MTQKQKKTDYSSTPLPAKLGIKDGARVLVIGNPGVPALAVHAAQPRSGLDVIVYFTTQAAPLAARFGALATRLAPAGGLWICWPKKSSSIPSELSFEDVQGIGLAAGLVDNKSCAIDEDWQGLRFVVRVKDRGRH